MFHDMLKHIETKYHNIHDMVRKGAVKLEYVVRNEKIIDVLTMPLDKVQFKYFRERHGDIHIEVPRKREWQALAWCKT